MSDLKDLYKRFLLELWNEGGGEAAAAEIVSDDFVIHQAGRPEDVRGPQAVLDLVRMGSEPFDDVRVTIAVGPIAEGDYVSARWTFSGSYRGGIPGTTAEPGTAVEFGGNDILRVGPDGRFAEYWVSSDGQVLMAQLGAA